MKELIDKINGAGLEGLTVSEKSTKEELLQALSDTATVAAERGNSIEEWKAKAEDQAKKKDEALQAWQAAQEELEAAAKIASKADRPTIELEGKTYQINCGIRLGATQYTTDQIAQDEDLAKRLIESGSGVIVELSKSKENG